MKPRRWALGQGGLTLLVAPRCHMTTAVTVPRNKAFPLGIISFCVSLRSYMLDTVAISAFQGFGVCAMHRVDGRDGGGL